MSLQTALVVDDSKLARITLQRLLQKHDLTVELAESGVQALEKLKSMKPDIIFMDHLMPEIDGFEATQKIKADPDTAHIPVIMCTGKEGMDNYEDEARGIGASGILSKPPQDEQLALVLAAARSGEHLVSRAAPATGDSTLIDIESNAEEARADITADVEALVQRLNSMEQETKRLPSFDSFQERMTRVEQAAERMQEALINIRNELSTANESGVSEDDFSHFKQEILQQVSDNSSQQALEQKHNENSEKLAALEQELASLSGQVTQAQQTSEPSSDALALDEEGLIARAVQDVERTLTPLLEEELKGLEERMSAAVDDAISESRKDVDAQLHESIRQAELSAKPVPGEPDLDNLIDRIRSEVQDIATHAAASAVEVHLEDRMASFQSELSAVSQQGASASPTLSVDELAQNPALTSMIEGTVEEQLRGQISEQGEALVGQITAALQEQSVTKDQELTQLRERFLILEEQHQEVINQLASLQESQKTSDSEIPTVQAEAATTADAGSSGSGGSMAMAGIAILTALVALAKAFGMF